MDLAHVRFSTCRRPQCSSFSLLWLSLLGGSRCEHVEDSLLLTTQRLSKAHFLQPAHLAFLEEVPSEGATRKVDKFSCQRLLTIHKMIGPTKVYQSISRLVNLPSTLFCESSSQGNAQCWTNNRCIKHFRLHSSFCDWFAQRSGINPL